MTGTDTPLVYCFGEVLWDLLPHGALPGGAPFNVACHLSRLQQPCGMISSIGNDRRGRQLRSLMQNWGVDDTLLQINAAHPTGEVLAEMDEHHEMSYEIRFPAAWDFIAASPGALEKVAQAPYFVYGSLAARHTGSRSALIGLLEATPLPVLDVNLRPPFFEKALLEELLRHAQILKTNQHELNFLHQLFGKTRNRNAQSGETGAGETQDGESDANAEETAAGEASQVDFIRDRFQIPEVIVTKGAEGAAYYTPEGTWKAFGVPVKVADTIGSGDSFLAAFITGHARQDPPGTILQKAVAMGAFVAARKGGCPEYQLAEFEKFCAGN